MELNAQCDQAEESYDKDVHQKNLLVARVAELETLLSEKQDLLAARSESLHFAEAEPGRIKRQIASIENAHKSMESERRSLQRKIRVFDHENDLQAKRREEAEKLKRSIMEKLELNRQTLEEREQDVATVKANLEVARSQSHDLTTRKVELNVKKRDLDGSLRHLTDQLTLASKEFETMKRLLKKKRVVADSERQLIPEAEDRLKDEQALLRNHQDERARKMKEVQRLRAEVDDFIAKLMNQEGVESEKKKVSLCLMSFFLHCCSL